MSSSSNAKSEDVEVFEQIVLRLTLPEIPRLPNFSGSQAVVGVSKDQMCAIALRSNQDRLRPSESHNEQKPKAGYDRNRVQTEQTEACLRFYEHSWLANPAVRGKLPRCQREIKTNA